jgi:hypothetical protein
MRCAGDCRAADRRAADRPAAPARPGARLTAAQVTAVRLTAALVTAGLLAGCSSGGHGPGGQASGATGGQAAARRAAQGFAGRAVHAGPGAQFFTLDGPGGGGAFVAVAPSSGSGGGRPKITVGPIPPASSTKPIDLPLNTYSGVSGLQQTVLAEASTLLTQKCMTARGFVYSAQAAPAQEQSLLQDAEYGFGVTSQDAAASFGYGQPTSSGPPPTSPAPFKAGPAFLGGFASFGNLAKQPRAWVVALLGFAPGARNGRQHEAGCLMQASAELYGTGRNGLSDPVPSIALQASSWTQSDPRVRAVDELWSQCMKQRGYSYRTPQAAATAHWPQHPTPAETATAVADVACKQQVNLTNTWLTVEAAYQTALIGQDLPTLSHLQDSFQSLFKRAQALLSGQFVPSPVVPGRGGQPVGGVVIVGRAP